MLFYPQPKSKHIELRFSNAGLPADRKYVCPAGGAGLIAVVNVDHGPWVLSRKCVKCFVLAKSLDDVNDILADRSFTAFRIRLNVKRHLFQHLRGGLRATQCTQPRAGEGGEHFEAGTSAGVHEHVESRVAFGIPCFIDVPTLAPASGSDDTITKREAKGVGGVAGERVMRVVRWRWRW